MIYNHPEQIPKSALIKGLRYTGQAQECGAQGIHGDTYPLTWAADDGVYTSSGDPNWAVFDGVPRHVGWDEAIDNPSLYPHTGGLDIERIDGVPGALGVEQLNTMPGFMGPGGRGAKPSGILSVGGALYLAAQNLLGDKPAPQSAKSQHGSDATILRSDDYGRTWSPDIQPLLTEMESALYDRKGWVWRLPPEQRSEWRGWRPMFPGPAFGGPSFVQFGKDSSDAVDEYVYAVSSDQWDNGSELRLGRVHRDRIMDARAWAWAVTDGRGSVQWAPELAWSRPVLTIHKHVGLSEMVYLPSLKRYLLLTWGLHRDFHVELGSELTILESEHPWGPFRLVHYEKLWESVEMCPYCPRVPLKWFDHATLSGQLLFSGSWHTVEHYKAHTRSFRLDV